MITGEYVFYSDGVEISRSKNIITKFGKRFLTEHLAGITSFNYKDIAIGIANGTDYPVSDANSRLGFEFYKSPVNFGSVDIQPDGLDYSYSLVYKTSLPQDVVGTIKEVGLYPSVGVSRSSYDSRFLSTFENNLDWKDSDGYNPSLIESTVPRIGNYLISIGMSSGDTVSVSKEYTSSLGVFDLSGYSVNDSLSLAFNKVDSNASAIKIKFYSSPTDYFYVSLSIASLSIGNNIVNVSLSDVFNNSSGTPDATNISTIGIELTRASASSQSYVYLDALRINDEDTFDPAYGMISRSVLATPIEKIAGKPIDIEYKITLGF